MWNDICSDARIGISKRLLGLRTTAEYLPTHSIIDARVLQLSAADGAHLKHLLTLPMEEMVSGMANFRPQLTVNGNYLAELCCSRDGAFAAVQLRQFSQLSYEPVTMGGGNEELSGEGSADSLVCGLDFLQTGTSVLPTRQLINSNNSNNSSTCQLSQHVNTYHSHRISILRRLSFYCS